MPDDNKKQDSNHTFVVTVSDCSAEQAEQVIAERISFDEDYGFSYTIGYTPMPRDKKARP